MFTAPTGFLGRHFFEPDFLTGTVCEGGANVAGANAACAVLDARPERRRGVRESYLN